MRTGLFLAVAFGLVWPRGGLALEADLTPERVPRPYLAIEPWPGFWPGPQGANTQEVLLDSHTQFARWERLRKALAERGSRVVREAPARELAAGVSPPDAISSGDPLYWESTAFREAWAHALDLARVGNAAGAREILELNPASTLEGERVARQLVFATAVAQEDRAAADSLYYRLSWEDAGRTATRLKAWEAMEERRPERAVSVLETLMDPTWGEDAVLALARWQRDPRTAGMEPVTGIDAPPLAATALDLARARWAWVEGDAGYARQIWEGIPAATLPATWRSTYSRLETLLSGSPGIADEDVHQYREATRLFLAGDDEEAESRISSWLGAWPVSVLRANAYLMRAHVRTARGDLDAAEGDLRAAERLAESAPVADRVQVVRAFILAQRGQGGRARTTLESAIMSPLGARVEAELRFNAARLARLAEDDGELEATILQLEEGFPGEPWAARARADTDPAAWRSPFRSLPPEPAVSAVIMAPSSGPWARLLWGEDFLTRQAVSLHSRTFERREDVSLPEVEEVVETYPMEVPVDSRKPMAFADLGIGGPAALILGGGVAGMLGELQYRADLAKTLSEGRNDLPDYRRTDWEAGLGMRPGDFRLGVSVEGTARTDDDAPTLGLSEEVVEASWWGARGDVGFRSQEETGVRLSGALIRGEVEQRHADRWKTDQTWFSASGGTWLGSARWDGSYTLGVLDYEQPGGSDSPWYHDLRVTRNLPGGWYVGGKGALYQKRVLLLPVAGFDSDLGSGFTFWAASEPSLALPDFRETFVNNGDWNLPDLSLPAERRWLDLGGGLKWADADERSLAVGGEFFRTSLLRTWERRGRMWEERAIPSDATGFKATGSGAVALGPIHLAGKGEMKSVRAEGRQVPYVPRYEGWIEAGYAHRGWRWVLTLSGVSGREDEMGEGYGDYLRWDLDIAYRFPNRSLPLGVRNLEVALGIDNLTDVDDRRWPGIPAYGIGMVAGVRALYGD